MTYISDVHLLPTTGQYSMFRLIELTVICERPTTVAAASRSDSAYSLFTEHPSFE